MPEADSRLPRWLRITLAALGVAFATALFFGGMAIGRGSGGNGSGNGSGPGSATEVIGQNSRARERLEKALALLRAARERNRG